MTTENRARRKVRIGKVRSNKTDKTVTVRVKRIFRHPLYERVIRRSDSYKAHDQNNECGNGDVVEIMETRPLSKTKRWRVVRIVEKAK